MSKLGKLIEIEDLRKPIVDWYKKYYDKEEMVLSGSAAFATYKYPSLLEEEDSLKRDVYNDIDFFTTSKDAVYDFFFLVRKWIEAGYAKDGEKNVYTASITSINVPTDRYKNNTFIFEEKEAFQGIFTDYIKHIKRDFAQRYVNFDEAITYSNAGLNWFSLVDIYDPITNRFYKKQSIKLSIRTYPRHNSKNKRVDEARRSININIVVLHDITDIINRDLFNDRFDEFLQTHAQDLRNIIQYNQKLCKNEQLSAREILFEYISSFDFANSKVILTPDGDLDFSAIEYTHTIAKIYTQHHLAHFPEADKEIVEKLQAINIDPTTAIVRARFYSEFAQKFIPYVQWKVEDVVVKTTTLKPNENDKTSSITAKISTEFAIHKIAVTSMFYNRLYFDIFPIALIDQSFTKSTDEVIEKIKDELIVNPIRHIRDFALFSFNFLIDSQIGADPYSFINDAMEFYETYQNIIESALSYHISPYPLAYFGAMNTSARLDNNVRQALNSIFSFSLRPQYVFEQISKAFQKFIAIAILGNFPKNRIQKYAANFSLDIENIVKIYGDILFSHFLKAVSFTAFDIDNAYDFLYTYCNSDTLNYAEKMPLYKPLSEHFDPECGSVDLVSWYQSLITSITEFDYIVRDRKEADYAIRASYLMYGNEQYCEAHQRSIKLIEKFLDTLERQRNFYNLSGSILIGGENFSIEDFINVSHSEDIKNLSLVLYRLEDAHTERGKPISIQSFIDNDVFARLFGALRHGIATRRQTNHFSVVYTSDLTQFLKPFNDALEQPLKTIVFSPKFYLLATLFKTDNTLDILRSTFKSATGTC